MNDDEPSDWLRARLRAADPARHVSAPRNLELTEAHMTTSPSPAGPNRRRPALVAAAAAVLVLAGVGLVAGLGGDDEPSTTATSKGRDATSSPPSPDTGTTATYTLDPSGQAAGRCIPPSADQVRSLDVAFMGVVTERTDDQVVFDVRHTWKAPQEQSRVVLDVKRAEGAIAEALPISFEVGKEYVVGVKQGNVRLCGWTAEASPMLEQEYDAAFPGRS